ncbi:MAG TPA: TraB/GumN family protein [Stellaceae bacterium]|nr:TraB/GumN family protein [Stellaceae bacterium]
MPNRRFYAVALLLLAALIAGAGRAEAAAEGKPIWFYRAESPAGRATFFYPSFHLRDARVPRPPIAMLDSVDRLVLEADIVAAKAHREAVMPYLIAPEPRDLATLFTASEVARINARASCNGLDGAVARLKLSFIATILALPCPKAGGEGGSYEEGVELAAQQRGLKVTGLESAEEEFAALAALPDRLFIGEIKQMAAHPDRADQTVERMIRLYNGGDFDGLYKLMLSDAPKNAPDRKLFVEKVLLARNRHMVERLTDVLAQGNALVVIGALHFPGAGGIIDLLKQQGYRVTKVDGHDGVLR